MKKPQAKPEASSPLPVIYAGTVTPEQVPALLEELRQVQERVGPETDLAALAGKRPMVDRLFILCDGRPVSARGVSHAEFQDWVLRWFGRHGVSVAYGPTATTVEEREQVLREMVSRGISPTMLRE